MSVHLSATSGPPPGTFRPSPRWLERALESAPTVLYAAEPAGEHAITYVSPNVERLTGFVLTHMGVEDREAYARCLGALVEGGEGGEATCEHRLTTARGEIRRFRHHLELADPDGGGTLRIVGCMTDVTAERRLERLLHDAIEGLPDAFSIIDRDGYLVLCNRAFASHYGVAPDELAGITQAVRARRFLDGLEQFDGERVEDLPDAEVRLRRLDGEVFWAAVSARLIEFKGEDVIVSSTEDLTERHALEREMARQREALYQSEKLSAMGELLAGVAHELNNPLSVVVGQALLLRETLDDSDALEGAEVIARAAERCARIVKTFLAMARQRPAEIAPVGLNALVEAALEVTAYSLRSAGIDVSLELEADLAPVIGDASQLGQVLTNLLVNAQHALEERGGDGRLAIRTRIDRDAAEVVLEVADNGSGIPDEVRSRVFEPFFTTKDEGVGTGIGLALCHRIVESHEGRIDVRSAPGAGTTFVVRLPAASPTHAPEPGGGVFGPETRALSALVIDDEIEVAEVLASILRHDGHEAEIALSGADALARLSERDFDVILSDLRMPNLDGPSLYRALAERDRALLGRLAFITGDTMSPNARTFLDSVARPCIEKPVTPAMLRDLVEILRPRRPGSRAQR